MSEHYPDAKVKECKYSERANPDLSTQLSWQEVLKKHTKSNILCDAEWLGNAMKEYATQKSSPVEAAQLLEEKWQGNKPLPERYWDDKDAAAQPVDSSHSQEQLTAEEFIREKIREKNSFPEKYVMEALHRYSVTGEDCLRWAHEYKNQFTPVTSHSDKDVERIADEYAVGVDSVVHPADSIIAKSSFIAGYKAAQSSPVEAAQEKTWWQKLGIKFNGKWYSHPKTNTYDNLDQVIQELKDWKEPVKSTDDIPVTPYPEAAQPQQPKEELLPNLSESTASWDKIKDTDKWLSEIKGEQPKEERLYTRIESQEAIIESHLSKGKYFPSYTEGQLRQGINAGLQVGSSPAYDLNKREKEILNILALIHPIFVTDKTEQ